MTLSTNDLRRIPPVDRILQRPDFQSLLSSYPRHLVIETIQRLLEELRLEILQAGFNEEQLTEYLKNLGSTVGIDLAQRLDLSLKRVINATGVLIHTNAGRAPLSPQIGSVIGQLATGYTNLEYDLSKRSRGHRDLHFEERVTRLLNAEAATVCNNNAAAVFLILNTLAEGKNVVVSRGELVEIGGSFRIPAIMQKSGALLREVGTTNKTRISDYRDAIDENTGLLLRVHPSNYRIVGFTQQPTLSQLVELAREKNIPLAEDVGSGHLFPNDIPCLQKEPTVVSSLQSGVDLVCFSGDKILGGPQAGLIVGRKTLIKQIRKNPLMRVLRVDKLTYAALEHTLMEYEKGLQGESIPIQRMMRLSQEELQRRSQALVAGIEGDRLDFVISAGVSVVGGGSAPLEEIPTTVIRASCRKGSVNELDRHLRESPVPILARIEDDQLILDLRTVFPEEEATIKDSLSAFAQEA